MLHPDPRLPFLDMAWSRGKMVTFFNERVLPATSHGREVTGVKIERMRYKPGKECLILYSFWFGDSAMDPPRFATVSFGKHTRLEKIYSRHYGGHSRPPSGPAPGGALFLPEYPCLVEFFPTDWKLPSLAGATDPREVAAALPYGMAGGGSNPLSPVLDVQVVRYRPRKRCVLRYVAESPDGSGPIEVIGKVYPQGPKAAEVWHKLDTLHVQGIRSGVIIPKPLGVVGRRTLILMERVPGTNMRELLEGATDGQAKEAIRVAAAALAVFHGLRFESQEMRSLESDLGQVWKQPTRLHLVAPLLAQQVEALLHQIAPLALRSRCEARSLIHGDYKLDQLLMDEGRVSVVDLDRACLGDPAIDVGNFMADLHREAVITGQDHLHRLSTYFLSEYQARLPEHEIEERARLSQIIALVRMSVRSFRRFPYSYSRKGTPSLAGLLLEEAAAYLAGL